MRIETSQGLEIRSLNDWKKLYETPKLIKHWKEHRSAYSVADFVLNRNGGVQLQDRVSNALHREVTFDRAIPEYEIRFDSYGKGRVHDLALFGQTSSGESIFVGVEAKVDEPFRELVRDAYLGARAKKITGLKTNAPERIEALLQQHFSSPDVSMFDVRYQLLYATAGTLAANADLAVLYVIVFKTPLFNESIASENYKDYLNFITKIGGRPIGINSDSVLVHEVFVGGRKLVCLHEHFQL